MQLCQQCIYAAWADCNCFLGKGANCTGQSKVVKVRSLGQFNYSVTAYRNHERMQHMTNIKAPRPAKTTKSLEEKELWIFWKLIRTLWSDHIRCLLVCSKVPLSQKYEIKPSGLGKQPSKHIVRRTVSSCTNHHFMHCESFKPVPLAEASKVMRCVGGLSRQLQLIRLWGPLGGA